MITTTFNAIPGASSFARQITDGYQWLRFDTELEGPYRQQQAQLAYSRIRIQWMVFFVIALLSMVIDLLWLPDDSCRINWVIRLTGLGLPALAVVLASFWNRFAQMISSIAFISAIIIVLALASTWLLPLSQQLVTPVAPLFILTFFIWFFAELSFRQAIIAGLLLSSVTLVGRLVVGDVIAWDVQNLILLTLANVLAAVAAYQLEYGKRTTYLKAGLLNELAERDGMSGLYNRRMLESHLARIWRQAMRDDVSLAVALVDVDYFKAFNEHYGHQKGDDVIRQVAVALAGAEKRPFDMVARYSGQCFAVVWYASQRQMVESLAETLRGEVKELGIRHALSCIDRCLTVSVGVSITRPEERHSVRELLDLAEVALDQAKDDGRDAIKIRHLDC